MSIVGRFRNPLAPELENAVPAVVMSESTEIDEPRVWWKEAIKRQVVSMCGAALVGGNPHADQEIRDRYTLASPTSNVRPSTPPTLIIHGGHDQLVRPENLHFLDKSLTNANVPHETLLFPYAQHGFDYNINGWGSQVTEKVMLTFLASHTGLKER